MKYLIISIAICSALLTSCDNRKDYFSKFNSAPTIEIKRENTNNPFAPYLYDSIWIGNSADYVGSYKITDQPHDSIILKYENEVGDGDVTFNQDQKTFTVTNFSFVKNRYKIITEDKYGAQANAELQLYKINNRFPVAKVLITQTNANALKEINISAANSFDIDMPYGDHITEYQYKVGNTYTVNTVVNNINYIAASTGTVMVRLKVKDALGALSVRDSVVFNVQ